jgi:hypothetical protein
MPYLAKSERSRALKTITYYLLTINYYLLFITY